MIKTYILVYQSQTLCLSNYRLSLLGKQGIFYYYTVAEMHIFLSKVDFSRLANRSRIFKSVSRL